MLGEFTNYKLLKDWIPPDESGVYVISKYEKNNKYKVLYVGKADPFNNRKIKTAHQAKSCWESYTNYPYIKTCEATTEKERTMLEDECIHGYNPPCNENLAS